MALFAFLAVAAIGGALALFERRARGASALPPPGDVETASSRASMARSLDAALHMFPPRAPQVQAVVREYQTIAGLPVTGEYEAGERAALVADGIEDPPQPWNT